VPPYVQLGGNALGLDRLTQAIERQVRRESEPPGSHLPELQVTASTGDASDGDSRDRSRARRVIARLLRRPAAGPFLGAVIVYVFFAIFAGNNSFVTVDGTASWADQAAELGIVAVPVGVLMIAGEFDLSIASVIGLGGLTVSIATGHYGLPLLVSIAIALALSVMVGLINGFVTTRTGVPSFIVTMATYFAIGGASLYATRLITSTTTVGVTSSGWLHSVLAGSVHQFNVSVVWCVGIALVAGHVLWRTVFGNWIFATGGDKATARAAGVPTNRVKVTLFVTSSAAAGLLGVIQALEYGGGQVGQGDNFIFDAVIAAVVGGVLLQGGYGSALGIMLGVVTYSVVNTGIFYTGWDPDLAQLIIGVLVLIAVLANNRLRQRVLSSG